jgi:hypothetical protein
VYAGENDWHTYRPPYLTYIQTYPEGGSVRPAASRSEHTSKQPGAVTVTADRQAIGQSSTQRGDRDQQIISGVRIFPQLALIAVGGQAGVHGSNDVSKNKHRECAQGKNPLKGTVSSIWL